MIFLGVLLGLVCLVTGSRYVIPDVRVEVYAPRGVRIWIPHEEGTKLFAFHGNLNRPMRNYEIGEYYKDVLEPVDGMWVYEDKVLRLRPGDKLHYWVYVLFNRLGYRRDDLVYTVTDVIRGEMPPLPKKKTPKLATTTPPPCEETVLPTSTPPPTDAPDTACEKTILRLAPKLINLELELEDLKSKYSLLTEIVNAKPTSKLMKMRGRGLSREEDPLTVVKFVLREKLDLRPEVVFADRNSDGSIDFQVGGAEELLAVVRETRARLTNSRTVQITF